MNKISIEIDGVKARTDDDKTILEAATDIGIEIPSLCYLKNINNCATCRICIVEIEGRKGFVPSCITKAEDGMVIHTNTKKIRSAREKIMTSLLNNHYTNCTSCIRNLNCELQNLADNLCIRDAGSMDERVYPMQDENSFIVRDYNKCITCHRCESICRDIQTINVYKTIRENGKTFVAPEGFADLAETNCITCGQCVISCPTASLSEKEEINDVWDAIEDKSKTVIVQTAPSVQVTLGEYFGMETGQIVTGKMISALHMLGFDMVFPTDATADLTIMEEATEFLSRLEKNEKLPMFSSCCPAWVKFAEIEHPELLPNLSSCKSPHSMFTALFHRYLSKEEKLEDFTCVAIMPCTAKKYEAHRKELREGSDKPTSHVLTTRELGRMIRKAGIKFEKLPDSKYDTPFDIATGAGTIFGTTGGVIEAAVRCAYSMLHDGKKELGMLEYTEIDGMDGLKEATVDLGKRKVRIAVAHGIKNARRIIEHVESGEKFDFIEVMACPGGCVGGGGQPIIGSRDSKRISLDYRHNRADALFHIDETGKLHESNKNPRLIKLYEEFLGYPGSEKAKKLLHTTYTPKKSHDKT